MSSSSPRPPPPSNGLSSSGSTSSTSSTASNSTTTTTTTSSSSTQAGGRPVSLTTLLGLFTHNNNASNSSSAQPQPTPPHQHEHSTSSANSVSSGSSDSASNGAAAATGHGDDNSAQGRSSGNAILSPASVQAKLGKVKRAFSTLVKRTDSPSTSPTGAAAAAGDTHTTGNSHSPVTILPNGTQITLAPRPGNLPVKDKAEEDRQRRQFEVILDNVKRKEDQENRRNEKKDKQVGDLITRWTTEVLPNWKHQMRTSRKAVEELVWHGIPPNVRGKVWLLAAGNDLHITPDLYHIFLTHARNKLRATNDEEGGWEVNEDATAAAAAATANGSGSAILHNSLSREQSVHLISLDVSRTFPHLCIFQKGGPYYDSLRSVLEAYVCYRPDVGYVQGMSFLASMLLLNVDVVDAFICLANLLNRPVHLGFYRMDTNVIYQYLNVYRVLLEEHLPQLAAHLNQLGLNPDMYLIDWILTIYSKALPLDLASRVWDVYMMHGDHFLFRCALGILKFLSDQLLKMQFGDVADLLIHLPQDMDVDLLFRDIMSIPLTKSRFDDLLSNDSLHEVFSAPGALSTPNSFMARSASALGTG